MTEQSPAGKRIRYFRERRGLTQRQLGEAAGILEATIRKYEIGQRNPKPDQIKLIADALGVTPNALAPVVIETDADAVSLILAVDDQIGITFDGKKDSKGKIDPKTLTIHIEDGFVNDALARWANAKNHLAALKAQKPSKNDKAAHEAMVAEYEEAIQKAKQSLLDSNKLVGKSQGNAIAVKTPPDLSKHLKPPKTD